LKIDKSFKTQNRKAIGKSILLMAFLPRLAICAV
jgi:hypothetical protein